MTSLRSCVVKLKSFLCELIALMNGLNSLSGGRSPAGIDPDEEADKGRVFVLLISSLMASSCMASSSDSKLDSRTLPRFLDYISLLLADCELEM